MIGAPAPALPDAVNFTPTLLTAAFAGAFSAVALPLLRSWLGHDAGINVPFILALVVTVAFPAKTFVIGPRNAEAAGAGGLDTAMLKRIGAWLLAAAAVTGLRVLLF